LSIKRGMAEVLGKNLYRKVEEKMHPDATNTGEN
jgi:hypothetical protein